MELNVGSSISAFLYWCASFPSTQFGSMNGKGNFSPNQTANYIGSSIQELGMINWNGKITDWDGDGKLDLILWRFGLRRFFFPKYKVENERKSKCQNSPNLKGLGTATLGDLSRPRGNGILAWFDFGKIIKAMNSKILSKLRNSRQMSLNDYLNQKTGNHPRHLFVSAR